MHTLIVNNAEIIINDNRTLEFTFKVTQKQLDAFIQNKPDVEDFNGRVRKITRYLITEGFIEEGEVNAKISLSI